MPIFVCLQSALTPKSPKGESSSTTGCQHTGAQIFDVLTLCGIVVTQITNFLIHNFSL